MSQLEQLMNAIAGIESGGSSDPWTVANPRTGAHGKWQIMPSNWSPWAREAGLPGDAPRNAANQRRVATHKLGQYLQQYGPEGAAVAWFAGPARARRFLDGDRSVLSISDGNTTVQQYVDRVRRALGQSGPTDSTERMAQRHPQFGQGAQALQQPMSGWEAQAMGEDGFDRSLDQQGLERMVRQMFERSSQIMAGIALPEGEILDWARPSRDDPVDENSPTVRDLIGPLGREGLRQALEQRLMQPGDLGLPSDGQGFDFEGTRATPAAGDTSGGGGLDFLRAAQQFEGVPYQWGGTSPRGFDCSGIIQYVLKTQFGVNVPRVSRDQARTGENVGTNLDNALPGDLVAFPARGLSVGHIGIYAGRDSNGRHLMLHAPRTGRNVTTEAIGNRRIATIRRLPQLHGRRAA